MPEAAQTGRMNSNPGAGFGTPALLQKGDSLSAGTRHACLSCLEPTIIGLTSWVKYLGVFKTKHNKNMWFTDKTHVGVRQGETKHDRWTLLSWLLWRPRTASGMTILSSALCLDSKKPFSRPCFSFALSHINLRTTQKSTGSSNWHV